MIRYYLRITFIIFLVINICGCAEVRRKFIRKGKPRREEVSFYRIEEYKTKPPHERYQDHYILWHNWHLDLERTEGTSHLRDINSANEALRHLTAMRDLLKEEKAEELEIQIKYMERLLAKLKKEKKDIVKDVHSRKLLERVGRIVVNNFSYNRMRNCIKDDSPQKEEGEDR